MSYLSSLLPSGLGLGLVLAAIAPAPRPAPEKKDGPGNEVRAMRQVTLTLSTPEAFPEKTVRLTETIPAGVAAKVRSVHHEAVRIGDYDPDADEMVPLDPDEFLSVDTDLEFTGLPCGLFQSHAAEPRELTPRTRGFEFDVQARRLGTYLIRATWHLDGKGKLYGPPVVLTVRPPTDEKGRPVVKPEWLKDDE